MNFENFELQSSFEANYLNVYLGEPVNLDEIAIRTIENDSPDFLIPFKITDINGRSMFRYRLINTVALEYADKSMSGVDFLQFSIQVLKPFVKGRDWFLDYHFICINPVYVFVERNYGGVKYIYIPEAEYINTDSDILEFLKNTLTNVNITDDKDLELALFKYFAGGTITLNGLWQLLQQEKEKRVRRQQSNPFQQSVNQQPAIQTANQPQQQVQQSQYQTPKNQFKSSNADMAETHDGDAIQALFGGNSRKHAKSDKIDNDKNKRDKIENSPKTKNESMFGRLFSGKKDDKSKQDNQQNNMGYASNARVVPDNHANVSYGNMAMQQSVYSMASDQTEVIGFDEAAHNGAAYLELIDSQQPGAMPIISLAFSKPFITIGRLSSDENRPDIAFPAEFKRIGRKHARIEINNNNYYLIDLGSVNHTLINGTVLVPNQPYQLVNGMEIAFTESRPVRYRVHM